MRPIYLDNNATTMIHPEVAETMREALGSGFGNPASQHYAGRRARQALEHARESIARLLGATATGTDAVRLIFTSGGTESNNLALRGLCGSAPRKLVVSSIEHPSVLEAARCAASSDSLVGHLPVDGDGVARVDQLPQLLDDGTKLVSVMLGNNETGVLQPVSDIAAICRSRGVLVHTDAVQVVGKCPVHFHELGVDALSFSAHKFHGPTGIGGLLIRHGITLAPVLVGGFQQAGLRPGTESVALALGLLKALQLWERDRVDRVNSLLRLRNRLESRLRAGFPQLQINGLSAPRLPHTSSLAFPGLDRQALVMALDRVQIACSTGSACASGSTDPSPVLLAMGLPAEVVSSSIRLSLSALTSESDVDEAAERILKVVNDLRRVRRTARSWLPPRVPRARPI